MGTVFSKKERKERNNDNTSPSKQQQQQQQQKEEEEEETISFKSEPDDWPWIRAIRSVEILRVGETQPNLPVKIHDNLYLGNSSSVQNINRLQDLGITKVLNMAGPMALKKTTIKAFRREGISYKQFHALDETDYPLLENHWQESYDYIHNNSTTTTASDENNNNNIDNNNYYHHRGIKTKSKHEHKQKNILPETCVIHCVAALNRSVLIAAACYMIDKQIPVLETIQHIRKQRGNAALQNEGFQEQLVAFARYHNLLGAKPVL